MKGKFSNLRREINERRVFKLAVIFALKIEFFFCQLKKKTE